MTSRGMDTRATGSTYYWAESMVVADCDARSESIRTVYEEDPDGGFVSQ